METYNPTIFIIDDNPAICESTRLLMQSIHLETRAYLDPQTFLQDFVPHARGCIISDVRMSGISGLTLQSEIKKRGSDIGFIFISGHSDASVATEAMKNGAIDFLVKPVNSQKLLDSVQHAIAIDQQHFDTSNQQKKLIARVNLLTPREKEVMHEVAAGKLNKVIAGNLGVTQKTVELHRSNLMKKLNIKSLPELVRLVDQLPSQCTETETQL